MCDVRFLIMNIINCEVIAICHSDTTAKMFCSELRGGIGFWTFSRFHISGISMFYLFSINSTAGVFNSSESSKSAFP